MLWEGSYGDEQQENVYMPFEGRLVEIEGLDGSLEPNVETKAADTRATAHDFNGARGRCVEWDGAQRKYLVHTFGGVLAGVPEGNLREFEPDNPEAGGFDVAWPAPDPLSLGIFSSSVGQCLQSRGFCVVQMFTNPAVREAAVAEAQELPPFTHMRAEMEAGTLGIDNTTKCAMMEMDRPDKVLEDALSYCDRDLTSMGLVLHPIAKELGIDIHSRTGALVRTQPGSYTDSYPALSDEDVQSQFLEEYLALVLRRRLCLLYTVENEGGVLELYPKEHLNMGTVKLPMEKSRMVLFRHDMLGYSYKPQGDSVALQMWLLDGPKTLQFRELPSPPGLHAQYGVHMMSGTERFVGNVENCNMALCMFSRGTDCESMVPYLRFDKDLYYMEDREMAPLYGKAYHMHGSFVSHNVLIGFDNKFFDIAEEEATEMSPSHRWVLETGYEVLQKGGWTKADIKGKRIGTFIGDSSSEWNIIRFDQNLYTATVNLGSVTVGRLAYCLGMTGPCISVDTACSASLVGANAAAHLMRPAIGSEPKAHCDVDLEHAVCMGILVMLAPFQWIGECAGNQNSLRGRCFTFDESADGYSRSEGCCAAYMRPVKGGDMGVHERSLAVLLGTCVHQDGKAARFGAPNGPAQQQMIRTCMREAGLREEESMLGECHGTGTLLGDPIEVGSMRSVMLGKRTTPIIHCTSKAHTGHTEANAGTCGLLKIMLMANASFATANPHIRALNPHIDLKGYPVNFANEIIFTNSTQNIMGVSSFSAFGTNARCDLWADAEKGMFKHGTRTLISKEEAYQWIEKVTNNVGTENEFDGFIDDHKHGH
mmetsp:Transcript_113621/g.321737  ORF Transcript_113621/g.321737 Transcript_113621/m.321737 type:complete len:820 (+) Transcript_113621:65-2524(+)